MPEPSCCMENGYAHCPGCEELVCDDCALWSHHYGAFACDYCYQEADRAMSKPAPGRLGMGVGELAIWGLAAAFLSTAAYVGIRALLGALP